MLPLNERERSAADVLTGDHGHEVPDHVRDLDDENKCLEVGVEAWEWSARAANRLGL